MAKNPMSVHQIKLPIRPNGYSRHYAIDWQKDPPFPPLDNARFERNLEAVRSKYTRQG